MCVVRAATSDRNLQSIISADFREVRPELRLNFAGNNFAATFGAEHHMQMILRVGMGHLRLVRGDWILRASIIPASWRGEVYVAPTGLGEIEEVVGEWAYPGLTRLRQGYGGQAPWASGLFRRYGAFIILTGRAGLLSSRGVYAAPTGLTLLLRLGMRVRISVGMIVSSLRG